MTTTLILARVALWVFFILPICARMVFIAGDPLAAILTAAILGTLAQLVTALPEDG